MPICSSGTQCLLYSAALLGKHGIGPHANPPSHIILILDLPVGSLEISPLLELCLIKYWTVSTENQCGLSLVRAFSKVYYAYTGKMETHSLSRVKRKYRLGKYFMMSTTNQ